MKKTLEVYKEYNSNAKKAINRFFKKYPELDYWKEQFEWMEETGTEFFSDNRMNDGTRNPYWSYALHLDQYDGTHTSASLKDHKSDQVSRSPSRSGK